MNYLKKVALATVFTPFAIASSIAGALAMWVAVVVCKEDELNAFFERHKK